MTDKTSENPNVNFLFKAMLERDPKKRRVKPIQSELVQVNFGGLDDSEEDSDFDINKLDQEESAGDDDEMEDDETDGDHESDTSGDESDTSSREEKAPAENANGGSETEGEAESEMGGSEEEDETDEDDETDDDESDDSENNEDEHSSPPGKDLKKMMNLDSIDTDEDDEDYLPKKEKRKMSKPVNKIKKKIKQNPKKVLIEKTIKSEQEDEKPQGRIKVVVCCVCLSDRSADDDEIVECDNCGISVHEGCYGIAENQSMASTESSASTEPWFCDACKAHVAKPVCELCPNSGGIYKETDTGKWVHIVCALYTPGVAFGDVDKLSHVTLFEMPYSKWGAKECCLCEDARFSNTGVCVKCDAGMCKAFFHVTCAQREGLLSEVSPDEVMDIADPFFAYCKLHADKIVSKMKRRNWLAIQSHVNSQTPTPVSDDKERSRFERKLKRHREKYGISKTKRPPSWIPTHKMVRHLHTSPSALRGFLLKAELMGVVTQTQTVPHEKNEARKKSYIPPSFTSEFINYYLGRNAKMETLDGSLAELKTQNSKLRKQESMVRYQYEVRQSTVNTLKQKWNTMRREGESLCGILADIYGKPVANIPDVFKSKKRTRSPSKRESMGSPTNIINKCDKCRSTLDQHQMVKCDSCKNYYHLGCLDPPLTRMPKKTKLFGWQCSFCVKSSSDDSMKSAPDVDQPRKLRENIKEPEKFFHLSHVQDSLQRQKRKHIQSRKRQKLLKRKKSTSRCSSEKSPKSKKLAVSNTENRPRKIQSPAKSDGQSSCGGSSGKIPIHCAMCNKDGLPSDTVRCDDCMLSYHFQCLNPPTKKSPKVRGYAWHCEACKPPSESDESDEDGEEDKKETTKEESPLSEKRRLGARAASSNIVFDDSGSN